MSGRVLHGKAAAQEILGAVARRVSDLRNSGINPRLVFVITGHSAAGIVYAGQLAKLGAPIGIEVVHRQLPDQVTLADLDREVSSLNTDTEVDGIVVQMPLPDHLSFRDVSTMIHPRKDVDGITVENAGRLYLGLPGRTASTAVAMIEVLDHAGIDLPGLHAVVVGRSQVVGHPLAELLLRRDATVTIAHRQTRALGEVTRLADVLLVAAGRPNLVTPDMVGREVVIIDAGINVTARGMVGDVDFAGCLPLASAITPVPGGVGPVTNAVLLRSVVDSAQRRHD